MASLLFIHGACSTGDIWSRQRRHFPHGFFPTLPGFSGVAEDRLISAWANWLADTYPHPWWIVAHSLGGAVAATMVRRFPDRVAGWIAVGTAPLLTVNPSLMESLTTAPRQALTEISQRSLAPTCSAALRAASRSQILRYPIALARRQFAAAHQFDASGWLSNILPAKAVIVGRDDRMVPVAQSQRFADFWPATPVHQIADAGHLVMIERPNAFDTLLATLLPDVLVRD